MIYISINNKLIKKTNKEVIIMKLSIVTIGMFVGLLNQGTKYIVTNFIKKDVSKFIPILSVVYGIILAVVGYFMPTIEMGSDIIEAIIIGVSAGSSSTGIHQIAKQLTKTQEKTTDKTNSS